MNEFKFSSPDKPNPLPIEDLWIDPEYTYFLQHDVRAVKDTFDSAPELSWEVVRNGLRAVNEKWITYHRWRGGAATISGIIRVRDLDSEHDISKVLKRIGLIEEFDEKGAFYRVENHNVTVAKFAVQERDAQPFRSDIGCSFFLDDFHTDTDDETDEGDVLMFPDDVTAIEFEQRSCESIFAELRYNYPELLEAIDKKFDDALKKSQADILPASATLSVLQSMHFSDEDIMKHPDLRHKIGLYIDDKCNFKQSLYDATVKDRVFAYSNQGGFVKSERLSHRQKLSGFVRGIELTPSEKKDFYSPAIVFGAGLENKSRRVAYILPTDNISHFRNQNELSIAFGQHASKVMSFPDFGELESYRASFGMDSRDERYETMASEIAAQEDKQTEEIPLIITENTTDIVDTTPDTTYDEEDRELLVSCNEDVQIIYETIKDHAEAFLVDAGRDVLDENDADAIEKLVNEVDLKHLENLTLGRQIRIDSYGIVLIPREEETVVESLEEIRSVHGTFAGVVVYEPVATKRDKSKTPIEFALILNNCRVSGYDELLDDVQVVCSRPYFPNVRAVAVRENDM